VILVLTLIVVPPGCSREDVRLDVPGAASVTLGLFGVPGFASVAAGVVAGRIIGRRGARIVLLATLLMQGGLTAPMILLGAEPLLIPALFGGSLAISLPLWPRPSPPPQKCRILIKGLPLAL
jgi:hypothetical protein